MLAQTTKTTPKKLGALVIWGASSLTSTVATKLLESFQDGDDDDESIASNENDFEWESSISSKDGSDSMGSLTLDDIKSVRRYGAIDSFQDSFSMGHELGSGGFGVVYQCYPKAGSRSGATATSTESYAVKEMLRDNFDEDEINALNLLRDCPHIVKVEDVFHELDRTYIVMQECRGGELLTRIHEKTYYTEQEARMVVTTLIEAVGFCHSRGIAHRDIKPENILLKYEDDDTTVQLGDFGLAKRFWSTETNEEDPLVTWCGSVEYAAPEVFSRENPDDFYDERCDIFSIGIVMYVLLAGYHPFDAPTSAKMIETVRKGKVRFHSKYWKDITEDAKELILALMEVDPDERCELEEALEAPWLDPKFHMID